MRPAQSFVPLVLAAAATAAAATAAAAAAAPALAGGEDEVRVRLKLTKDAEIHFEQNVEASTEFRRSEAVQSQTSRIDRSFTLKCTNPDAAGGGAVEAKFRRVRGFVAGAVGRLPFDSDRPAPAPNPTDTTGGPAAIIRQFTAIAGKTVSVSVGPTGKLGEILGLDAETGRHGPSGVAAVRDALQSVFVKTTEAPLVVGGTWTDRVAQEPVRGSRIVNALTFRVVDVSEDAVTIAFDGVLTQEAAPEPAGDADPAKDPAGDAAKEPAKTPPEAPPDGRTEGRERGARGAAETMKLVQGVLRGEARISRSDGMALEFTSATTVELDGGDQGPAAGTRVESTTRVRVVRRDDPTLPEIPREPRPPVPPEAPPAPSSGAPEPPK